MANKALFKSAATPKAAVELALVRNEAGGLAYELPAKHALAQYAVTGCLNGTFYASAEDQLAKVLELARKVEPEFVAKCALYAREKGFMKDLPALLLGVLAGNKDGSKYVPSVFNRVVDNGKMLCNFAQMIRSGQCGRKSFGSMPSRLIETWLDARSDAQVFKASVGTANPSLADVLRMVHPKPKTESRRALYGWLSGRNKPEHAVKADNLPELVRAYEAFKANPAGSEVPDVPFLLLTALPLTDSQWKGIARNMGWQATRMNLNTMLRHKVFEDKEMVKLVADRLRDREEIRRARVFPYQLLAAYMNIGDDIPRPIKDALHDAMEVAVDNVPVIDGKVYVFPDVSGSMSSPVTGHRVGATSKVRCIDVAALVAASILRRNPDAEVIPFEQTIVTRLRLEPRDSIMTNAEKLAGVGGGGTNCSAPLAELNRRSAKGDLVVYVSDNESWVDSPMQASPYGGITHGRTATLKEWEKFVGRNKDAKMVCIDIQPYGTVQAKDRKNVLNVGGFSDDVFNVLSAFVKGDMGPDHWTGMIEGVTL